MWSVNQDVGKKGFLSFITMNSRTQLVQPYSQIPGAINSENIHFWSISTLLVLQSAIEIGWCWYILGQISFQHTFVRDWRQLFPLLQLLPKTQLNGKITIMQQGEASVWYPDDIARQ